MSVLVLAASVLTAHGAIPIVKGVHLIPGVYVSGSQPDGNTVVFSAPEGLIVVDSGRHQKHTQAIIDFAREMKQPVKAVINTHWHLDHTGGNVMLRREFPGVRVYASSALADAQTGFLANYRKQLVQMVERSKTDEERESFRTEMALIDAGAQLAPDVVVDRSETFSIAGRSLSLGLETNAVTAGDVWVYDPKTRVLVAGDLVTLPAPFLDTACPSRWKESLERLAKVDFRSLIPGHGTPMPRRDFERWRSAYGNLLTCSSSQKTKEDCVTGWVRDAGDLLRGEDKKLTRELMDYYVDLLRGDPAKFASLCN